MNDELKLKIESYLGGSMSAEEAESFSREIEMDPNLKAEVQLSADINFHLAEKALGSDIPDNEYTRTLKSYFQSDEAKEIEVKLRQVQSDYKESQDSSKRPKLYLYAAILTILIITTIGVFFFGSDTNSQLYASYYSPKDVPSIVTRGDETALNLGAAAFQNKEYAEAMKVFENYLNSEANFNPSVYIYTGLSNLELGQHTEAISEFDKLINSNSIDSSKGLWFKALAYLKMDQTEDAKQVLEIITESSNNFNYNKARELLDEL